MRPIWFILICGIIVGGLCGYLIPGPYYILVAAGFGAIIGINADEWSLKTVKIFGRWTGR